MATGIFNRRGVIRCCLTQAAWLALACCVCPVVAHPSPDDLLAQKDVLSVELRQWLADQNTAIRIGLTSIPPMALQDPQTGEWSGLSLDYIRELQQILGCSFELVGYATWNELMEAAFAGQVDIVYSTQKTPSREAAFLFTEPYLRFDNKIITTEAIQGPLTLEQLSGKTVAVVSGAATEEYIRRNYPDIHLLGVDDELIGLMRVSFNQADAMVVEIARASWYIQQNKFTNLRIAGDAGYVYELCFACRRDRPELRDIFDAGLMAISPARRTELMRRWIMPSDSEHPELWLWLVVAGGLAAALLMVFGWNRLLGLQVRRRTAELEQELDAHEKDLAALRRYETLMQRLFGNLRGTVYRCRHERDWPMEFISAGCEEMTGYADRAFYDGTAFWGWLIIEEDRDAVWNEVTRCLEKKERFQIEYRIRDRSGQLKWFWEKGCGVYDETGETVGLEGFITDITDRKASEKAMQDSESRYRELVDLAVDGILLGDHEGHIIEANSFMLSQIGKSRDELVGRHITDLFEPEVLKQVPLRTDLLQLGQVVVSERAICRTDGTTILVEMRTKMMPDGSYQSILRDITDRKRFENALRESEEQYRTLVDQAAEMLFLNDMDGRLIDVNQAAIKGTGYSRDELLRMRVYDIDPDADLRQDKNQIWDSLSEGNPITFEVRHRRKDGSSYWAEVRAGKLHLRGQAYVLALANDISTRKEAEQTMANLLKELRRKNEELQSIVFIASHDLRGPLVNIRGFAGELNKSFVQVRDILNNAGLHDDVLAKLAPLLHDDIPESLHFIDASSQKMKILLNGLLRLSRIGTVQINPTAINMEQLIGGIIGGLGFKIRQHNIDIAVEGSLPSCLGDLTLINQVFSNLVDNAVKYRHPERPCRIRIRGRTEKGRSVYEVEDNGIGIAPEHQQKIFQTFYQLNPAAGGDGLGLTIVQRVLDRQDGTITLESEPGTGTCVSITLPGTEI
ncbi:MAG: PAS domain S-box protein [Phycisphaerae bacterium]|nr:PAS domain S-box protein [Phycisphaerae bacterium]